MSRKGSISIKKILAVIAAVAVVFTGGFMVYLSGLGAPDPGNTDEVTVEIPTGSGASSIVDILDSKGLIKNRTFAKINARIGGYSTLQANTYVFTPSMTLPSIMHAINTGDFNYVAKQTFVLKDGATIPQAAEALSKVISVSKKDILKVWEDKDFLQEMISNYWFLSDRILEDDIMYPLEGYLFPDTYFLTSDEPSVEEVTMMMLDSMDNALTERRALIEQSGFTVHEFLSLASVVTSEGGTMISEAPKIAGVFINRLENNTPLQSDVTVNYALQQKRVDVSIEDTKTDSGYNTYKNTGLPVGPICAVPADDMDAVLNYEKTDYLFFYACPDGTVLYAKTSEEHQKNINENPWSEEDLAR